MSSHESDPPVTPEQHPVPRDESPGTGSDASASQADATVAQEGEILPPEPLAETIAGLTADDVEPSERRRLLKRLAEQTAQTWRKDWKPGQAIRWMSDMIVSIAPYISIRDLETLRKHHPGMSDEALADRLVRNAARTTAGIGAAAGGLVTVQWSAPPTLLATPAVLATETMAVIAVELKLVGELFEVYRQSIPGSGLQRASAMLSIWANRRGVNPLAGMKNVAVVLGTTARTELRTQIAKRFGRNLTTIGPFLTGAAVAGYLNRRSTRKLGEELRSALRQNLRNMPPGPQIPPGHHPQ